MICKCRRSCSRGIGRSHLRNAKVSESRHKAPVNPVLPAPNPRASKIQSPARGHRVAVPGADQGQPTGLGAVSLQRLAKQGVAQISRQWHTHAHRKNPRFFEREAFHARYIARRKNAGIGNRLQLCVHADKTLGVTRQARVLEPRTTTRLGDPKNRVGGRPVICSGMFGAGLVNALGADLVDPRVAMHLDMAAF